MKKSLLRLVLIGSVYLLDACDGRSRSSSPAFAPASPLNVLSVLPSRATAIGTAFNFSVPAREPNNMVLTDSVTVHFPSNDPQAVLNGQGLSVTSSNNSCRVGELLPRVTSHVKEFVENVNRLSATEVLDLERRNKAGRLKEKAQSKSNYVATINKEAITGVFVVEEYRNDRHGETRFQGSVSATGAPALALIFHPSHIEEFDMTCEGLADWKGHSVWRVCFEQRLDRPATMTNIKVDGHYFEILLKGFAWIDSDNYQIVHLETDLLKPIPEMRLEREHQSVDYGSVAFTERQVSLWLPHVAEVTVELRGTLLVARHTYSDYRVFFVDTGQKIGKPKDSSN